MEYRKKYSTNGIKERSRFIEIICLNYWVKLTWDFENLRLTSKIGYYLSKF